MSTQPATPATGTPGAAESAAGGGSDSGGTAKRRRLRPLRLVLWLLLQLFLLVLILLGFVLGTQTGLRIALGVVEDLMPDMIQVGEVEGRILGELRVADFKLDLPALQVNADRLYLNWSPGALLGGTLRVHALEAGGIDIVSTPAPKEPEPFALPEIKLPIGIDVERAVVEDLRFAQAGAPPESAIVLTRADLSATATGDRVDIRELKATLGQPSAEATITGNGRMQGDYPIALDLSWRFAQPPALQLAGSGKVAGTLADLHVTHRITGSATASLDARIRSVLEKPSWTGQVSVAEVNLPEIVADAPPVDIQAELNSDGNLVDGTVTGNLAASAPEQPDFGRLDAVLDVGWQDKLVKLTKVRLTESESDAALDLKGQIDLGADSPSFDIAGVWEALRWPLIGEAQLQSPMGKLDAKGNLDGFDYSLSAKAFGTQVPELALNLNGDGTGESVRIEALDIETLGGAIAGKGRVTWKPDLKWELALAAREIDPGRQWPGLDGNIGLKAESAGGLEDGFSLGLRLDTALDAYPKAVLDVEGTGTADALRIASLTLETLGGVVEGNGNLTLQPAPAWELTLAGSDLDPGKHYPGLDGSIALQAESTGSLAEGYTYRADIGAELAAYPPAKLLLAGKGTAEAASVDSLKIQVLRGEIDGKAEVAWAPALRWDAALNASGIDPGTLAAAWPGRIGGRITSAGSVGENGPNLTAKIENFGGELRGYPVQLAADVGVEGRAIALRELRAASGSTVLTAGGRAAERLDLRFDLRSPDLGALLPNARGSLSAEGSVGGTPEAPTLALRLDGRDAEVGGQGIASITGQADVGLSPDGDFAIDIDGAQLVAGGLRFDQVGIEGSGRMSDHRLTASLNGDLLSLALAATGSLAEGGAYRGALQTLDLSSAAFGNWGLQQPADFGIDGPAIAAGPLCIGNGADSGGCARFEQRQPGQFQASLDIDRFAFDVLAPALPEMLDLEGFVRATARFRAENNVLIGDGRIEVPEGSLELALPDVKDSIVFADTRLDVRSGADGLRADFALPLQNLGRIGAEIALPGFRLDTLPSQQLAGTVQVQLESLARVSTLVPDVTDVTGSVNADLRLGGTLAAPGFNADIDVREVGFRVPLYGIQVAQGNLSAVSRGEDDLTIDGSVQLGGGVLTITGNVADITSAPTGRISIAGNRLKLADSKEYFAVVSPDLQVGFGPGGGALQGRIEVPEARIVPTTLPTGAIQPSADVVFEDRDPNADGGPPFSIDVLTKLRDVSIDAFGLRGQLKGDLRVIKEPNRGLVGDGQLEVVDGTYRVSLPGMGLMTAIGKPLTVEQGIVVFAKTPLDNPGLVLSAQREGSDVSAGVRVLGTLKNPKLAFFSESDPDMTQAEITRYLVTGIPPKRDSETDDRALSVGTYIAPKIFMEYESSLGDQSDKVKMRYDLSRNVEIQSETGEAQGADIFYKFEN